MYVIFELPKPTGSMRHRQANSVPRIPDVGGACLWSIDVITTPQEPPFKFFRTERKITKSLFTEGATDWVS